MNDMITVDSAGRLSVRSVDDAGGVHRRVIEPGHLESNVFVVTDVSAESAEIQSIANATWTVAIKTAYEAMLRQNQLKFPRAHPDNYSAMIRRRAHAMAEDGDELGALLLLKSIGE